MGMMSVPKVDIPFNQQDTIKFFSTPEDSFTDEKPLARQGRVPKTSPIHDEDDQGNDDSPNLFHKEFYELDADQAIANNQQKLKSQAKEEVIKIEEDWNFSEESDKVESFKPPEVRAAPVAVEEDEDMVWDIPSASRPRRPHLNVFEDRREEVPESRNKEAQMHKREQYNMTPIDNYNASSDNLKKDESLQQLDIDNHSLSGVNMEPSPVKPQQPAASKAHKAKQALAPKTMESHRPRDGNGDFASLNAYLTSQPADHVGLLTHEYDPKDRSPKGIEEADSSLQITTKEVQIITEHCDSPVMNSRIHKFPKDLSGNSEVTIVNQNDRYKKMGDNLEAKKNSLHHEVSRRSISFHDLNSEVQCKLLSIRKSVQHNLKKHEQREEKRKSKRNANKSVAAMNSRDLMREFVRRSRESPFDPSSFHS